MAVFADTPRWPKHGTWWGHLVSDASLDELHDAAERAGLFPRSFDLDHYDWPVDARDRLEQTGVRFVDSRELTRRLIDSGLRVPAHARAGARRERTLADARALGLDEGAGDRVPRDFIWGMRGHVDPMPALAGAFRLTRDEGSSALASPRIQAHDDAGRRAAQALLARLDGLARARGRERFIGQAVDWPDQ